MGRLAPGASWWRLAPGARRATLFGLLAAAALTTAAALAWHWQSSALAAAEGAAVAAQDDQRASQQRAAADAASALLVLPPWWSRLPAVPSSDRTPVEQLSADALALAPKLGVEVLRVTFAPLPQASGAPYRSTAMQVELRGPYADVKRWLGELLARRPHSLALKSLDVHRTAEGAAQPGVEASAELRLYERDRALSSN
jgi:hypothetical protein